MRIASKLLLILTTIAIMSLQGCVATDNEINESSKNNEGEESNEHAKSDEVAPNVVSMPVSITMSAPDGGWRLKIEEVHEVDSTLLVIVRLKRDPGYAVQRITELRDQVTVVTAAESVKYYVIGKSWQWNQSDRDFVGLNTRDELDISLGLFNVEGPNIKGSNVKRTKVKGKQLYP